MRRPLFSVIIPTLNEEKFLPKLLASLSEQTQKNFEVIVVDGSSKDKTVRVATSYARKLPHLQVIVSKTASLPLQRNLGAQAAKGEWFVFVDADGAVLPYFVERIHVYINDQRPSCFTTWWRPDSEQGGDALLALFANLSLEFWMLMKRHHAPGPLAIVSREAFETVGGYDETHAFTEDLDFGMRLGKAGFRFHILRETPFIWSLRRLRNEGTVRVVQAYIKAGILAFFAQRAPKFMPGYIMGGHLYGKKKRSVLKVYERKLKALMKELFA